ncbi:hypothetical protein HLB23_39295 [Nocardia uniformis]|uniref:Uncharacterized protein n=1 Tax=Nocardia uniformis TaxID=53432 RepID=A0A849CB34_9NOCA|nr:hypothetical protein [Nocardia uniformis]NNH75834.1 hypothetical protein [Nocardia uniformis]
MFHNETTPSFVARLAAANHITPEDMHGYLGGSDPDWIDLEWTSIATGYPVETLVDRLPAFAYPGLHRLTIGTTCRHCAARRNTTSPVEIYRDPHSNVCLRHQLWIGGHGHQSQLDLTALPEVTASQRIHRRLARRHGTHPTAIAFHDASEIAHRRTRQPTWPTHLRQRLENGFYQQDPLQATTTEIDIITYPDAVTMTTILVHRDTQLDPHHIK